jgi:hypothetical protein
MKLEIQYEEWFIPEIIWRCFEFVSRSLIITVMKFAGIKENAIETKKTKFEVFLEFVLALNCFVNGNGLL